MIINKAANNPTKSVTDSQQHVCGSDDDLAPRRGVSLGPYNVRSQRGSRCHPAPAHVIRPLLHGTNGGIVRCKLLRTTG